MPAPHLEKRGGSESREDPGRFTHAYKTVQIKPARDGSLAPIGSQEGARIVQGNLDASIQNFVNFWKLDRETATSLTNTDATIGWIVVSKFSP